jgi:hypothetical protein
MLLEHLEGGTQDRAVLGLAIVDSLIELLIEKRALQRGEVILKLEGLAQRLKDERKPAAQRTAGGVLETALAKVKTAP